MCSHQALLEASSSRKIPLPPEALDSVLAVAVTHTSSRSLEILVTQDHTYETTETKKGSAGLGKYISCIFTSIRTWLPSSEPREKLLDMGALLCNLSRRGRPGAHWPASSAYWRVADQWETLSQKEKVDGQDRKLSSVLHTFCDTPTSQKESQETSQHHRKKGKGNGGRQTGKAGEARGREKVSLAFSSEEMVSLSLEIKLHTCSMPRLRNSSLSTTSAKCRSVGKPERDHQHHTSEEATSLNQPETRKRHRISSGREEAARQP